MVSSVTPLFYLPLGFFIFLLMLLQLLPLASVPAAAASVSRDESAELRDEAREQPTFARLISPCFIFHSERCLYMFDLEPWWPYLTRSRSLFDNHLRERRTRFKF